MNPKAFISHASEDKGRFVLSFAARLRAKGIDAWVDRWEMLPGDSILRKIFEEGIQNAKAVVVVLSEHSVDKKWVREELDAAIVRKINGESRLIPVVIDDCEIPMALQATLWERINDLQNYDAQFERIVMSILGHNEKPPLGALPLYAQGPVNTVPGLTPLDSSILKLACEEALKIGHSFVDGETLYQNAKLVDIEEDECSEALEILHSHGYIKGSKVFDGTDRMHHVSVTPFGFEEFAKFCVDGYEEFGKAVGLQIVNMKQNDTREISAILNRPIMLVNHIVDAFARKGWVKVIKVQTGDNNLHIYEISPELKRWLK